MSTCATSVRSGERDTALVHPSQVTLILVALAYFTLAYLGLRLASINPSATPIWPPTGLAIAAILVWGSRIAPAIFVASFLINQLTAGSISTSLAIACGNTLEAVIAGYLVTRWAGGEQVFDTPIGVTKFALISLVATAISATTGVSSLTLAGYAEASSFVSIWLTWWLGDLAGALVVAPVIVLWARSEPLTLPEITRTGLTYLSAAAVGVMAFSPVFQQTPARDALAFLVVLPLLWSSLHRGPRDTATVALIISAFVVWGTIMHGGPFARPSLNDSFLLSLAFMITTTVLSLALSTDIAVRQRVEKQQRQRALEIEALWQATVQVAFGGSFEDLLRGCLQRICRVTGWPAGHVYLPNDINADRGLLTSPIWHFEREGLDPIADEFGDELLGDVRTSKRSGWRPNFSESANEPGKLILLKPRKRILLKHGLRAVFGIPLYAEGKLQAVLEFFSTTGQPPDEHLLRIVQSIGEQLGRVLDRRRGEEQQRQAVAISDALQLTTIRSAALEATLNTLTFGVYLTDRRGKIIYINRAAERQVDLSNAICVANNYLIATDKASQLALAKAIDGTIGKEANPPASGFTVALPGEDSAGLIATIFPLGCSQHQDTSRAFSEMVAIFVQDPIAMSSYPGDAFADLYGLTKGELRVLLAMAPGLSVKEAAKILGVCETTVKSHLQHIYSKTGTSKRTALIHLFMRSTPPVKAA